MKPGSADVPGLLAKPPRSPQSRVRGPGARRNGNGLYAALTGFALLLAFIVGAILSREAPAPLRASKGDAVEMHAVGTIRFRPEGNMCREATIDTRTGQMISEDRRPCEKPVPSDPKEQLKERYSGGRLDAIRDSFRSR